MEPTEQLATAQTLRVARNLLADKGWHRGNLRGPGGSVCARGAILLAIKPTYFDNMLHGQVYAMTVVEQPGPGAYHHGEPSNWLSQAQTGAKVACEVALNVGGVPSWNDRCKDAEDVLARFDAAIAHLEGRGPLPTRIDNPRRAIMSIDVKSINVSITTCVSTAWEPYVPEVTAVGVKITDDDLQALLTPPSAEKALVPA